MRLREVLCAIRIITVCIRTDFPMLGIIILVATVIVDMLIYLIAIVAIRALISDLIVLLAFV